ncbi:hypothetical protein TPHA_0M01050 [Tetrapisispora phaffii CBS 4417]|uniref:PRP1 splicing factor N-terminal domain-containing protein n=1 Tax=Tetrapisispora phaffii (strain ATCC 24235 / CBS 4417 / NBRC 1672 / NRRL Y-8282 / UCD 70-5) TaxID=1071381 RepID=G8C0G4_TETPH|nr:hypothetical protein TPHA_0M01050 [Tetrapisispora phaffii CBS 4417]CCE65679.1 hypothetical protein TPHA_0M01050 [Tetrapisispora phaffii CBS 4417]
MERPAFLDKKPPPGYVPGIGRGATGFSTRGSKKGNESNVIPKRFNNNSIELDPADLEAENIFTNIDKKLANRNRKKASKKDIDEATNFIDLKTNLSKVSNTEWLHLPEATDITRRNKRQRLEEQMNRKFFAAPDTLLSSAKGSNSHALDLSKLTEEREKLLGTIIDTAVDIKKNDSVSETTDYLDALDDIHEKDLSDNYNNESSKEAKEKMRAILKSYRKSDPRNPDSWIASARLEKNCRNIKLAQKLLNEGCRNCPKSEEIWLENIKLNENNNALCRTIVTRGIQYNLQSLNLWLKAIDLESDNNNKQILLRKAITKLPKKEELWELAADYETDMNEKIKILLKAVEFVPYSINLWIKLINSQPYEGAKKSLISAKNMLPKEYKLCVISLSLEEKFNDNCTLEELIKIADNCFEKLFLNGVKITFEKWLEEAHILEKQYKFLKSAEAIIMKSLSVCNSEEPLSNIIAKFRKLEDSYCKVIGFKYVLSIDPSQYNVLTLMKRTCETLNKLEIFYSTFETILFSNPFDKESNIIRKHPILSLIYAKEIWRYNYDPEKALMILNKSIEVVPENVDMWTAKLKILCELGNFNEVESVFEKSINILKSYKNNDIVKIYYKHINYLRFRQLNMEALNLLEKEYIVLFPKDVKLKLQRSQIYRDLGQYEEACKQLKLDIESLPFEPKLSIALSEINESYLNKVTLARSNLDLSIVKNPSSSELYLGKINLEKRSGNLKQVEYILSQSFSKFPNDVDLWVEKLLLVNDKKSITKKGLFQDALKNTKNNFKILLQIGISFFNDLQYTTSLKWIERSIKSNPKYGDSWIWLSRCYIKLKKPLDTCLEQVNKNEPKYGKEWIKISKGISTQYLTDVDKLKECLKQKN